MEKKVLDFNEYSASMNPGVNEKRKVVKDKDKGFKLVKKSREKDDQNTYKFKFKDVSDVINMSDGSLNDEAAEFLKGELGEELFHMAMGKIASMKNKSRKRIIIFTLPKPEDPNETPEVETEEEESVITVNGVIDVGSNSQIVSKVKSMLIQVLSGIPEVTSTPQYKGVTNSVNSNTHDMNSGELVKIARIGLDEPVESASTSIDQALIDKLQSELEGVVMAESILHFNGFNRMDEELNTDAIVKYLSRDSKVVDDTTIEDGGSSTEEESEEPVGNTAGPWLMGYISHSTGNRYAIHFASPRPPIGSISTGETVTINRGWDDGTVVYPVLGTWTDDSGNLGAIYINIPGDKVTKEKQNEKYKNIAEIVKSDQQVDAGSIADEIIKILQDASKRIENLYKDTGYWKGWKGDWNDNEDDAVAATFGSSASQSGTWWYDKIVVPLLNPAKEKLGVIKAVDPDSYSYLKNSVDNFEGLYSTLKSKTYGGTMKDTHSWTISNGVSSLPSASYYVDTDF